MIAVEKECCGYKVHLAYLPHRAVVVVFSFPILDAYLSLRRFLSTEYSRNTQIHSPKAFASGFSQLTVAKDYSVCTTGVAVGESPNA